MEPDRWRQVEELYHAALEKDESQRTAFLREVCGDDKMLRNEIESLLAYEREAEQFIESPVVELPADVTDEVLPRSPQTESTILPSVPAVSLIGASFGHFQILAKVGSGGMGIVYLARDEVLGRRVAIKVLHPGMLHDEAAKSRFLREARAVASLNHPNIAVLYEVGEVDHQRFFAMEYIPGRTLTEDLAAGPMALQRLLEYGMALATALDHAHRHGVLHRDLKPSNVILPSEGGLKLLDFGLARFQDADGKTFTEDPLTRAGSFLGTLPYAPPEVLNGQPADFRSDIYSFGVMLYEMACGQLPFCGLPASSLAVAILQGRALPVVQRNSAVPVALSQTIERAMALRREDRFATAKELLDALRRLTTASAEPLAVARPSAPVVAIAEFRDIGGEVNVDWLGTGIVETLTADLKRIKAIQVVSRERMRAASQPMQNSAAEADLVDLGRRLGAKWVVAGSYQRAAERLRITFRLFDVTAGEVAHTGKVDGLWEEIFEVQDRVVNELVSALEVNVERSTLARIVTPETLQLNAYEHYAEGRKKLQEMGRTSLEEARHRFEQALSFDPRYAMAHSGLGATYAMRFIHRNDPGDLVDARGHLERARELDPELADPYPWLCYVYMRGGKWREAFDAGQRAIELLPDLVHAHYFLGLAYFASCEADPGAYQRAVTHLLEASRVDPRWQATWFVLARVALLNGNYERTERFAQRLLDFAVDDTSATRFIGAETILGNVSLRRGNLQEAETWFKREMDLLSTSDHTYRDGMRVASACGLGDTNLRRDRVSAALTDYRKAWHIVQEYPRIITRDRASARALAGLAAAYAAQGDSEHAEKNLSQAVETLEKCADVQSAGADASLPELYHAVAVAYMRSENHDDALDMLARAVQAGWRDAGWLERDLEFRPLISDTRFSELVRLAGESPQLRFESPD
jgi:serine/threonine protein kinase/Flp pilus assembly protein TadD